MISSLLDFYRQPGPPTMTSPMYLQWHYTESLSRRSYGKAFFLRHKSEKQALRQELMDYRPSDHHPVQLKWLRSKVRHVWESTRHVWEPTETPVTDNLERIARAKRNYDRIIRHCSEGLARQDWWIERLIELKYDALFFIARGSHTRYSLLYPEHTRVIVGPLKYIPHTHFHSLNTAEAVGIAVDFINLMY